MRVGSKVSFLLLLVAFVTGAPARAQIVSSPGVLTSEAPQPLKKKWSGEWSLTLGGTSLQEGKDEGAAAFLWFSTDFKYNFTKWLKAEFSPNASLYTSRLQERFDDDVYENRLWLMNAHVAVTPSEYFEVRGGSLNQGFLGSSMLVSSLRSFPGLQEMVKLKGEEAEVKFIVQQAVPTSHTLNTERERQEKLPTFNTESFSAKGKHFGLIEWKSTGGHFKWSNLPSKVAYESRLAGAMGEGIEMANSRFIYDHEGFFGTAELCLCMDSAVDYIVDYQRIRNTKADSFAADAQLVGVGTRIRFGDHELELLYRNFFIESDATVAIYNRSKYGHTNRTGNSFETSLNFKKEKFRVFAQGFFADPINRSEIQRDFSTFFIGVETDNASF